MEGHFLFEGSVLFETSVQKGIGGVTTKMVGWVEGAEIKGTTFCTAQATA